MQRERERESRDGINNRIHFQMLRDSRATSYQTLCASNKRNISSLMFLPVWQSIVNRSALQH